MYVAKPIGAALPGTKAAFLAPAGDYHLITIRPSPVGSASPPRVLCSEPSPDWATALAAVAQLNASGGVAGGPTASLAGSNSTTETITALAGRSAGVVALRDGLYSACQAYANGIIGRAAYALILSQYGNLLVALASAGGGGDSGQSGTAAAASPSGAAAAASGKGTAAGTAGGGKASGGSGGAAGANVAVAQMQQEALQALLVTCIAGNDTSLPMPDRGDTLLDRTTCASLVKHVIDASGALLKPQGGAPVADPAHGAGNPAPSAAVQQLQRDLNQKAGAGLAADGVFGARTLKAAQSFVLAH